MCLSMINRRLYVRLDTNVPPRMSYIYFFHFHISSWAVEEMTYLGMGSIFHFLYNFMPQSFDSFSLLMRFLLFGWIFGDESDWLHHLSKLSSFFLPFLFFHLTMWLLWRRNMVFGRLYIAPNIVCVGWSEHEGICGECWCWLCCDKLPAQIPSKHHRVQIALVIN